MDALTDYTFNTHKVHYHFCPKCGIRCFLNGVYVNVIFWEDDF
jgi:hypothetical protein